MDVIVYTQYYYRCKKPDRQLEIDECLRRKLSHPSISFQQTKEFNEASVSCPESGLILDEPLHVNHLDDSLAPHLEHLTPERSTQILYLDAGIGKKWHIKALVAPGGRAAGHHGNTPWSSSRLVDTKEEDPNTRKPTVFG